jgi:hypothetical protein
VQSRASGVVRVIFRIVRVKTLISKSLSGGDLRLSSQNLEPVETYTQNIAE